MSSDDWDADATDPSWDVLDLSEYQQMVDMNIRRCAMRVNAGLPTQILCNTRRQVVSFLGGIIIELGAAPAYGALLFTTPEGGPVDG